MERQFGNHHWEQLPADQFAALGLGDLAYVKPKIVEGQKVYAIHTADGNEVGVAPGREVAFVAVRQHDLEPVSVH